MILDLITAALIVIPMGIGMARGFLYIVVRLLGWAGAMAGAFFGAPALRKFLAGSPIGEHIHLMLADHFEGASGSASAAAGDLPAILGSIIDQTVNSTVEMVVTALEGLILTVISFLGIVVAIRLLLIFVIRPLTKRRGKSPVSFLNKLAGLLTGGIEGLLLAFLFLAALIPVMNLSTPETADSIAQALRFSYLAGALYDGNLLLAMIGQGGIVQ